MSRVKELEKKLYELKQELDQARRESPAEPVKNYAFNTPEGQAHLADLFGDKDELMLIHNMGASCDYCTMWADSIQSSIPYITSRANVVLVSPDKPEDQAKLAAHRGWNLKMLQDPDGTFSNEMGYLEGEHYAPGTSTFKKQADGTIVRTNHTQWGPLDDFCPTWHVWSLFDGNSTEWHPTPTMFTRDK